MSCDDNCEDGQLGFAIVSGVTDLGMNVGHFPELHPLQEWMQSNKGDTKIFSMQGLSANAQ